VRFYALTSLDGVGAPTASAILTLIDPRRYGVLDIRVVAASARVRGGDAQAGRRGIHLRRTGASIWPILRRHASALRAPVRAVEYSLFVCHERLHQGVLYGSQGIRIEAP
jgi:hypothetical protein